VVLSVSAPEADGTRRVETADGGAEDGATVMRHERVLSADGSTLTLGGAPARMLGVARAPESDPTVRDPKVNGYGSPLDPATLDPPAWVEVDAGHGYKVKTNAEPLARGGVPVPMSFRQEVEACRALRAVPLTAPIEDARLAQAAVRTVVPNVPSPDGAHHVSTAKGTEEARKFAAWYGPLGTALRAGGSKVMIAERDRRQVADADLNERGERGMAFYGWLRGDGSLTEKGRGDRHDKDWIEYGQYGYVVLRAATRDGEPCDLLVDLARGCPLGGPLAPWLVRDLGGVDSRVGGVSDAGGGDAVAALGAVLER
jgi:hypothetical protein